MNISIIGTGYVGLVSGTCFATFGHHVICVDVDTSKIEQLKNYTSPIYEKGLDELLSQNKKNITATQDYRHAVKNSTITFICVGTPSEEDGTMDLSYVKEAARHIAEIVKEKKDWHLIVVKSTVLPGTTRDILLPILEKHSGKKAGKDFGLAMNPEFLREGIAVHDFLHPDRIVIGTYDEKSKKTLNTLYKDFSCPLVETSLSAAEMIKYASNCFLATKISFINEIGNLCKTLDIDTYEVADGMGLDKRIGRDFLDSGIGWGGSCFPKDLHALLAWATKEKQDTPIIQSVITVNDLQPLKLIKLLKKHMPNLKEKTIGILGLSFKPNTDDIRESRSIPIVRKLLDEEAHLKVYDPKAMDNFKKLYPQLTYCSTAKDVLDSDAVIIATAWDEFKTLHYKGKLVIDGRKLTEAENAKIYEGVCW